MGKTVVVAMLVLLLASLFVLAFDVGVVRAQGVTVYINSDGSVSPSYASISSVDNVTYTFTSGVYNGQGQDGIVVERSNIIIDGAGYTVWGSWYGAGFYLPGVSNVTIENVNIVDFELGIYLLDSNDSVVGGTSDLGVSYGFGIELYSSFNNTVAGNNSTGNASGIYLEGSADNVVSGNDETESANYGVYVCDSWNNTVIDNDVTANAYYGICLDSAGSNTVIGNTATENSCGIWLCWNNDNNVVSGNDATKNTETGIVLGSSSGNVVVGNNATANGSDGIDLQACSDSLVVGNNATLDGNGGIYLSGSSDNVISGNVAEEDAYGVWLYDCSNDNVVCGNNATLNSCYGIYLSGYGIYIGYASSSNNVTGNDAAANSQDGIILWSSYDDVVVGNNVTGNSDYGIVLRYSSGDAIYHNNFVGNTVQALAEWQSVGSAWDDGYPCGGNYWSDYNGTDLYSGPFQNVTGSDGIGDTPYVIAANNTDDYPLMMPYVGLHDVGVTALNLSKTVVGRCCCLNMVFTAADFGDYSETFNVTVYANTTVVASLNVTLSSGTSATVYLLYNTTGLTYGNYTVCAYALPVPGQTNVFYNDCTGGNVVVTIPGDVEGNGIVDMGDINALCGAFGSTLGQPNYNPNCDIYNTGRVDMSDIMVALYNFGQHYQ